MDAAWLEDFLALVDLGHFSRAAEQRCITQPAFSRRVRALEDWVGAPLFTRDVLPVALTPAGERFRPVAEETLRRLYLGREAAREAGRMAAATVRIASTQTLSVSFFPNWIRTIEGFERIQATMNLTAAHMAACEQMMLRGEAQFLLCHDHPATTHMLASEQFRSVHLGTDRLLPVSAPRPDGSGPLFALGGSAEAPIPLLTYTGESGLGRILASSRAMERSETALRPVFASHLTSVLVAMARDAHGVAWAPLSVVADDLERGRLCRVAGEDADIAIEIKLYRPRARQSPAAERLWTLVAGRERDAVIEGDEAIG
jgi:DNA-binding transcriptional LysR family regulator